MKTAPPPTIRLIASNDAPAARWFFGFGCGWSTAAATGAAAGFTAGALLTCSSAQEIESPSLQPRSQNAAARAWLAGSSPDSLHASLRQLLPSPAVQALSRRSAAAATSGAV